MLKYIIILSSMVLFIGCAERKNQIVEVNYDTILSDSLVSILLLDKSGIIEFEVQEGIKMCNYTFRIIFLSGQLEDTVLYHLATQCIFGDTIIHSLEIDQNDYILDRIYYNNEKSVRENISVDLLERTSSRLGNYYFVLRYEIDCEGKFNYLNRTSKFGRELTVLTSNKPNSGTYILNDGDLSTRLELRDGETDNGYAMLFEIGHPKFCRKQFTKHDMIVNNNILEIIVDTLMVELKINHARLSVRHFDLCDTVINIEQNLSKKY